MRRKKNETKKPNKRSATQKKLEHTIFKKLQNKKKTANILKKKKKK